MTKSWRGKKWGMTQHSRREQLSWSENIDSDSLHRSSLTLMLSPTAAVRAFFLMVVTAMWFHLLACLMLVRAQG
jgi:hypothetical protein